MLKIAGLLPGRPHLPKVVRCSAGCLYTALHGYSRSGRLRTRFTNFPHSVDMDTWTNQTDSARVPMALEAASTASRTSSSGAWLADCQPCSRAVRDGGKTARSSPSPRSNSLTHQINGSGRSGRCLCGELRRQRRLTCCRSGLLRQLAGGIEAKVVADELTTDGRASRSGEVERWL